MRSGLGSGLRVSSAGLCLLGLFSELLPSLPPPPFGKPHVTAGSAFSRQESLAQDGGPAPVFCIIWAPPAGLASLLSLPDYRMSVSLWPVVSLHQTLLRLS